MNTDKLLALLDRHGERSTAYRHLAARYRQAVKDVARQQAELTAEADGLASELVQRPADALVGVSAEDLLAAGISDGQRRRLAAAKRLAARLQLEVATAAEGMKQSQMLVDNLIEYARQRGESVSR